MCQQLKGDFDKHQHPIQRNTMTRHKVNASVCVWLNQMGEGDQPWQAMRLPQVVHGEFQVHAAAQRPPLEY
jgi:hypothetical protein